ncbi:MAG: ferredoxin [Phycisphaerae bacterium]|nr:ferredoxin [Phycisphaerae bacterium]
MRATVDDSCIGCGLCAETCPAVFEMGEDDLAHVKANPVPADAEDAAREAAEACPVDAIALEA